MAWRVLGRWMLYTIASALFIALLLLGAGDWHGDNPKGSMRSILLCAAGSTLGGAVAVLAWAEARGTPLLPAWPLPAAAAAIAATIVTVLAWRSIAADIRRRPGR